MNNINKERGYYKNDSDNYKNAELEVQKNF